MRVVAMFYGGPWDGRTEDIVGTEQVLHVFEPTLIEPRVAASAESDVTPDLSYAIVNYRATGQHRILEVYDPYQKAAEMQDQREFLLVRACLYCGQPIDGHTHALGDVR